MKIAIYQSPGTLGDTERNLKALHKAAAAAARSGVSLLILPEMFLTGYNIGEAIHTLAEPADGASARRVAEIARDLGIAILYGYPERSGEMFYDAAQLIEQDGSARANYRKTHIFRFIEKHFIEPGGAWVTVECNGLKIGLMICFDIEFPESVRTYAIAGLFSCSQTRLPLRGTSGQVSPLRNSPE